MADRGMGWELDRRAHFDEIVTAYDRIRPDYPEALFADIFHYAKATAGKGGNALEIGAGTGKATRPLLEAGYTVTAVEVGANMAEFLRERYKEYVDFNVIVAPFEDAALDDNAYDLIYAATAFHWVDAEIGCPKAMRLLKPGGVFALFRCNFVPGDGGALNDDIQEQYKLYFHKPYKKPAAITKDGLHKPSEIMRGFGFDSLERYGFMDIAMKLYDSAQVFGADEYIALLETFSDHRMLPDNDRAALYAGVRQAIIKHGGSFKVDYIFQLYMGRKL